MGENPVQEGLPLVAYGRSALSQAIPDGPGDVHHQAVSQGARCHLRNGHVEQGAAFASQDVFPRHVAVDVLVLRLAKVFHRYFRLRVIEVYHIVGRPRNRR